MIKVYTTFHTTKAGVGPPASSILTDAKVVVMFPHAVSTSVSDAVHPEWVSLLTTQFDGNPPDIQENIGKQLSVFWCIVRDWVVIPRRT
jgi:hypothetical protein